jgi:hypothetical protein
MRESTTAIQTEKPFCQSLIRVILEIIEIALLRKGQARDFKKNLGHSLNRKWVFLLRGSESVIVTYACNTLSRAG